MATVVKNFRIKSGLIVEGATGTIGGNNILTESTAGDSYILNLVGGATLVKSVDSMLTVDGSGKLTINANTYDAYGSASAAQSAAATDATNKANAALSDAQTFATNAAGTAETNANTYTDNTINALTTADIEEYNTPGRLYFTDTRAQDAISAGTGLTKENQGTALGINRTTVDSWYDAAGSAATAESNANTYADNKINDASNATDKVWSAYKTSTEIGLAQAAAEQHADDAVAALVGSAPAVLDTIQELATALENNPDIIADLENVAAGKQNTLTAGSNIDITADVISVTGLDSADISDFNTAALAATSAAYDAAGSAAAAQTAAEATAQAALDDVLDATTPFTDLNINDVAKQVAARTTSLGSVPVVAYQFNKSAFKSGKFLVKIDNGTHNEISEILVTLDSSDNVAITEYAIVGTNGSRGTITANTDSTHCRIVVDPVNDSTITVSGIVFNS
jgi:hypothetical protein